MSTETARGDATAMDLLAAVKMAVAAKDISNKAAAFDLIEWIMAEHEPDPQRSGKLFYAAIEATKVQRGQERASKGRTFVGVGGGQITAQPGGTARPLPRQPENTC